MYEFDLKIKMDLFISEVPVAPVSFKVSIPIYVAVVACIIRHAFKISRCVHARGLYSVILTICTVYQEDRGIVAMHHIYINFKFTEGNYH